MKFLRNSLSALGELLWPSRCALCRNPLTSNPIPKGSDPKSPLLCSHCLENLEPLPPPLCRGCSHPLPSGYVTSLALCPDCYCTPPPFERVLAPFSYSGTVRELIHLYKYGGDLTAGRALVQLLLSWLEKIDINFEKFSYICPVPSSRRRIFVRGFDHIWLLAKGVGERFSDLRLLYPFSKLDSPPQMTLDLPRRIENARKTISILPEYSKKFYRKGVILLDDVYSSGSTARVCSQLLLDGGASRVLVLVLARGVMSSFLAKNRR